MQLYPYQVDGVDFLARSRTALLGDDPGLGKSIQAIRACDEVRALYVCIVCPAGLVENWKREIARHRQGDWQAFVTSYERAAGKDRFAIWRDRWDVMIVDEAHYLKSVGAKRTTAIYGKRCEMGDKALAGFADRVWILTGTPMPNHTGELFTHLRALRPDLVTSARTGKPWTVQQFEAHYCIQKHTGFGLKIAGSKNEAELNEKLKGFMLRRRKADVLKELPDMTFGEVWLEASMDGVSTEEAEIVRQVLKEHGVAGLRRIALNGSVSALRRYTGLAKAGPAADWVNDWLDGSTGKIVVFAHHHDVIEALYDKLHVRAVRVTGETKQKARQAAVDAFQNDPKVRCFIGNIQAAGVGITLTAASDLLFVESSWVPADMEQAAQRIHRIGQKEKCLVRFAMVAGSIDEDIQRAVARKMKSIAAVVDGEIAPGM